MICSYNITSNLFIHIRFKMYVFFFQTCKIVFESIGKVHLDSNNNVGGKSNRATDTAVIHNFRLIFYCIEIVISARKLPTFRIFQ